MVNTKNKNFHNYMAAFWISKLFAAGHGYVFVPSAANVSTVQLQCFTPAACYLNNHTKAANMLLKAVEHENRARELIQSMHRVVILS